MRKIFFTLRTNFLKYFYRFLSFFFNPIYIHFSVQVSSISFSPEQLVPVFLCWCVQPTVTSHHTTYNNVADFVFLHFPSSLISSFELRSSMERVLFLSNFVLSIFEKNYNVSLLHLTVSFIMICWAIWKYQSLPRAD